MKAAKRGFIPGLKVREVKDANVGRLVRTRKPVVAIVPYFAAHAVLLTKMSHGDKRAAAIDTVSGMQVELDLNTGLVSTDPSIMSAPKVPAKRDEYVVVDGKRTAVKLLTGLPRYFVMEIVDSREFLAWLAK